MISAPLAIASSGISAGLGNWLDDHKPWKLAGKAITGAIGGAIEQIFLGIWQLALKLLQMELWFIGAVSKPDVSASGPLHDVIPISLAISLGIASIMMFCQISLALWRRDGHGLVHVFYGTAQWALVYVGTWGVCAGLIESASHLENAIISAAFDVPNISLLSADQILGLPEGQNQLEAMARDFTDVSYAAMFAVVSLFLFIPAALLGITVALARTAGLLILTVTLPISASGLISELGSRVFWRSARWFLAALLIGPNTALLFAIGVQAGGLTEGRGKDIIGSLGTAIVAGIIMLMAAASPVPLYRIFGWVEPGSGPNAQMKRTWQDGKAGLAAMFGTGGSGSGSGGGGGGGGGHQASKTSGDGHRAAGEENADGATQGRMAGAFASMAGKGGVLGKIGQAGGAAVSAGHAAQHAGQKVAGSTAGQMFAKGQGMAMGIATAARNTQADVLSGSGVSGERPDNYPAPPARTSGGGGSSHATDLGQTLVDQSGGGHGSSGSSTSGGNSGNGGNGGHGGNSGHGGHDGNGGNGEHGGGHDGGGGEE